MDGIWGTIRLTIKKGGYLLFHLGIKSDHRIIWTKIANYVVLGSNLTPNKSTSDRKLILHHPKGQKKFISKLKLLTREHNILPQLRRLEGSIKHPPLIAKSMEEHEEIDRLLVVSIIKAEASVQKLHMSGVQSSRMGRARQRLAL